MKPTLPSARVPLRLLPALALLASTAVGQQHLTVPLEDEGLPGTGTIRRYEWFQNLWRDKRAKWAEAVEADQGAVVFFGDSITQGWGDDMGGSFPGLKVANRGISGDTTRGMLLRLPGDVLALNPSAVVMLMGTNDLEEGDAPESIAANIRAIVDGIAAHGPDVPVVLCKVFPSAERMRRPAASIRRINELVVEAVDGLSQVTVLDTWTPFADANGDARKAEFPDLLHPNEAGYRMWAGLLRPVFDRVLNPTRDELVQLAEQRFREVYDRGALRPRGVSVDWLPDGSAYTQRQSNGRVRVDVATGETAPIEPGSLDEARNDPTRNPDGSLRLSVDGTGLRVRNVSSGETTVLHATAPRPNVGIRGPQFSPDGTRVLFTEVDFAAVRLRNRILADDPSYPSVEQVRFARVGETIETLRVGVVPAAGGGEVVWLDVPAPERGCYLGQVEWAGNPDEVFVEWMSRFRDERRLLLCNATTGEAKEIYRETDPAWVVASHGVNPGIDWVRGGEAFVMVSERDGWRHVWLHARDGKEIALLTPGDFDVLERAAIDEAGGNIYFYASPENATQRYLYRAPLAGGEAPVRVTPADQPGTHEYRIAPDGRHAFHAWSTFDQPPVHDLVELPSHRTVRVLEDNTALRVKLVEAGHRPTEFLQVDVDEGVTLDAWLMKPPGFDPNRKWPVVVYVYSEPHAQTVLDSYGAAQAEYHRVLTDLGYLVLSIDGRGTPAPKGAAWRRAVFGSLGPLSTADQAAALEALAAERPYIDLERVGIWGWSGGGSNTLNAMFRRPDLYDVGIAVASKPQPHLYNAWFQEIYMRDREVNPDGYRQSAPIHFAEGLAGDLLIVHGTGELNTHVQIVEGLVDRLVELGKQFDYFSYPHRRHGIREGEGTTVHLRTMMARYFVDHLAPGPR
ncbi:MAG: DPP IV N-terminal domain-containing protein [Planctomycetota bacterium]|nr:DPP IV N-terminal domain-containing protein [Planctomycetota bacterium]